MCFHNLLLQLFHICTYDTCLSTTIFSGTKPVPGTWKNWKVKRLQSKPLKRLEKEASQTAEQMMHAAALNKECKF